MAVANGQPVARAEVIDARRASRAVQRAARELSRALTVLQEAEGEDVFGRLRIGPGDIDPDVLEQFLEMARERHPDDDLVLVVTLAPRR